MDNKQSLLQQLPAVDRVLNAAPMAGLSERIPHVLRLEAAQQAVADLRQEILEGGSAFAPENLSPLAVAERAAKLALKKMALRLRPVINATGTLLHTNLGRAPLSPAALEAMESVARSYSNLEFDLETGERGHRFTHIEELLCRLTGAEAATVVNNNAAATLLILNTLAQDAEVIVSRGQLVEIGGAYRLPEMMSASGAVLREVGTTNRTRIADYERAISDRTAAILRVHTSNYRIMGFTQETPLDELVALARRHNLLVIDDLGSGALFDLATVGLPAEPDVRTSLAAGADLACFSGDKLLGGPQAGIIVGRRDLIARIEANPLMRTYRTDKMTLAALQATLQQYRDPHHAADTVPSLALLRQTPEVLHKRAQKLARALRKQLPGESFEIITDRTPAGGGSLPAKKTETRCVAWTPGAASIDETLTRLRRHASSVIARAAHQRILFDLRTIQDDQIAPIAEAAASAASTSAASPTSAAAQSPPATS